MKNIDVAIVKRYNEEIKSGVEVDSKIGEKISYFLRATGVRVDSDLCEMRKRKEIKFYEMNYSKIKESVIELQRKYQERELFDNCDIGNFIELNRYNVAKNRQVKIMAIASIVLLVIALLFEMFR